jgi:hypothetical protein
MKSLTATLFLLILATLLPACGSTPARVEARLGEEFTLAIDQEASLQEAGLSLKFLGVAEDSRCPSKVQCAWSGRAVISLVAQKEQQKPLDFTLITIHSPDKTDQTIVEGYQITLKAIEPRPELPDQPVPAENYRATLIVESPATGSCPPRPDDPTGYLTTICNYIQANQVNVAPADPYRYQIKQIEERTENGQPVVWVFLNCCSMGDNAVLDKATGQVVSFRVGAE